MNALCSAQHPARQFVNGGKPPPTSLFVGAIVGVRFGA
jgi:hypothetical protein